MNRHIVMLSGGPDSAYCLLRALETGNPVIPQHVNYKHTKRWQHEYSACIKLYNYLRNNYPNLNPIEFHDINVMQDCWDSLLITGIAVSAARLHRANKVWFGTVAEDLPVASVRDQMFKEIVELGHAVNAPHDEPVEVILDYSVNKQDVRTYLGPKIWSLTWSCREPDGHRRCVTCDACKRRNKTHD